MTDDNESEHLRPETNARGFTWMPPIQGAYGGWVRLRESSAASNPHVWLDVAEPLNANDPGEGNKPEATLHLTLERAAQLMEQLNWFMNNHYQVASRDE